MSECPGHRDGAGAQGPGGWAAQSRKPSDGSALLSKAQNTKCMLPTGLLLQPRREKV